MGETRANYLHFFKEEFFKKII